MDTTYHNRNKDANVHTRCILAISALLLAAACDDRRSRSGSDPSAPPRPRLEGAVNDPGEVTEADYLYFTFQRHLIDDLELSLPTRMHLSTVAAGGLQAQPGKSNEQVANERGSAIHRALLPEEDARFREILSAAQTRHVTVDYASVHGDINGVTVPPKFKRAKVDPATLPCPFENEAEWKRMLPQLRILTMDEALSILSSNREPPIWVDAARWLLQARVDPQYQDRVIDGIRKLPLNWSEAGRPDNPASPNSRSYLFPLACDCAVRWARPADADYLVSLADAIRGDDRQHPHWWQQTNQKLWTAVVKLSPDTARKQLEARMASQGNMVRNLLFTWSNGADPALAALTKELAPVQAEVDRREQARRLGTRYESPEERALTPENVLRWLETADDEIFRRGLRSVSAVKFDKPQRERLAKILAAKLDQRGRDSGYEILSLLKQYGTASEIPALLRYADSDALHNTAIMPVLSVIFAIDPDAGRTAVEARLAHKYLLSSLPLHMHAADTKAGEFGLALLASEKPEVRACARQILLLCATEDQAPGLAQFARLPLEKKEKQDIEALLRKLALRPTGSIINGFSRNFAATQNVEPNITRLTPKDVDQATTWLEKGTAIERYSALFAARAATVPPTSRGRLRKALVAILADADGVMRTEGIRTLIYLGTSEDLRMLNTLMQERDIPLAIIAAAAATRIDPAQVKRELERSRPEIVSQVFAELAAAGPICEDAGFALLRSDVADIRGQAADLLAAVGTTRHQAQINAIANIERDPLTKKRIQDALAAIQTRTKKP